MAQMTGVVTIVQEGRFQVTDDQGVSHLFILAPNAATETWELRPLADRQAKVRVRYTDGLKVVGRIAKSVDLCAG
ncbi:MAG: hypothetical protein INR64_00895 [Caulobacteraceae bacterium]|nr:hypothetical protein [Caulobacter sp.]